MVLRKLKKATGTPSQQKKAGHGWYVPVIPIMERSINKRMAVQAGLSKKES
jgi:hypothetical protein